MGLGSALPLFRAERTGTARRKTAAL